MLPEVVFMVVTVLRSLAPEAVAGNSRGEFYYFSTTTMAYKLILKVSC